MFKASFQRWVVGACMMLLGVMTQINQGRVWLAAVFGALFVFALVMAGIAWRNRPNAEEPPPPTN